MTSTDFFASSTFIVGLCVNLSSKRAIFFFSLEVAGVLQVLRLGAVQAPRERLLDLLLELELDVVLALRTLVAVLAPDLGDRVAAGLRLALGVVDRAQERRSARTSCASSRSGRGTAAPGRCRRAWSSASARRAASRPGRRSGPWTSSRTTVNAGTPGGIFGWSQQVVGPVDCSLFGHATDRNGEQTDGGDQGNAARQGGGSHSGPPRDQGDVATGQRGNWNRGKAGRTLTFLWRSVSWPVSVAAGESFLDPAFLREPKRVVEDLSVDVGAFLYGWHQGRLLYAIDADCQPRHLTSPEAKLTVTTRGFRVFSTRLRRVRPRAIAAAWRRCCWRRASSRRRAPAQAQMTQAQKDEVKLHYQRATRAYDLQKYHGGDRRVPEGVRDQRRSADALQHRPGLPAGRSARRGRALLPAIPAADAQRPQPRRRRAQDRRPGEARGAAQEGRAASRRRRRPDQAAADRRGEAARRRRPSRRRRPCRRRRRRPRRRTRARSSAGVCSPPA